MMFGKIISIVSLFAILAFSCKTMPETKTEPEKETLPTTQQTRTFTITQAYYASTKEDVQHFIDKLNVIIRNKNFSGWRDALSPEYIAEVSSPENLSRISEQPIMKRRNIVLRNLNDYFTHVVVPSRDGSRIQVDSIDIEFITQYKVRAFVTRTSPAGEELREILYNLEKIDNTWKIIN